jgi:hypothetical protein
VRGIPAALPARGGCTRRTRKDSFISRSRVSLSERRGGQSESRGLKCCQDQCTPLHDTNGNRKWGAGGSGTQRRRARTKERSVAIVSRSISHFIHSWISRARRFAWLAF